MRLVTRSDFDGLVCAVLLSEIGIIDSWKFVHPKDLQDGVVDINSNDVLANVPYLSGCGLWFDHHSSEIERLQNIKFEGVSKYSPSCARVIWEYYGGHDIFKKTLDPLLNAVDKVDSGKLSLNDIISPTRWVLLGLIMDPRTGLGRFKHFRISNYKMMEHLINYCRVFKIEDILSLPDVAERVDLYFSQTKIFGEMIENHTKILDTVAIIDVRGIEQIYAGNRFIVYAMYPQIDISVQLMDNAKDSSKVTISVGKSILNPGNTVDVGSLMLKHGGGGHKAVGTCQVSKELANAVLEDILEAIFIEKNKYTAV